MIAEQTRVALASKRAQGAKRGNRPNLPEASAPVSPGCHGLALPSWRHGAPSPLCFVFSALGGATGSEPLICGPKPSELSHAGVNGTLPSGGGLIETQRARLERRRGPRLIRSGGPVQAGCRGLGQPCPAPSMLYFCRMP